MREYKVGDHVLVKLSFGNETALIYPWQMVPLDA